MVPSLVHWIELTCHGMVNVFHMVSTRNMNIRSIDRIEWGRDEGVDGSSHSVIIETFLKVVTFDGQHANIG